MKPTWKQLYGLALFASVLLFGRVEVSATVVPAAVTYYACVNNSTGGLYLVGKTTSCKTGEHKSSWNQVGPRGPQGPNGAQGPQGPQGPPGISVGYSAVAGQPWNFPIGYYATLMLQTNPVGTSGTYFISAGVLAYVAAGDTYVFCYDTLASVGTGGQSSGGGGSQFGNYIPVSITDAIFISAGDSVQLWCYSGGTNGSNALNGGLTATLLNSSNKAKTAKPQHLHVTPKQLVP